MIIYNADGTTLLDIQVNDTSNAYAQMMSRDDVTLEFDLVSFVAIPLGSYIVWQGVTYALLTPATITIVNRRNYSYKVVFEADFGKLKLWRLHDVVDGRVKFELTAFPSEHLQLFVDNLNEHEGAELWLASPGSFDNERVSLSYNLTTIYDAVKQLADKCETEFEVYRSGEHIYLSLGKVEYNKNNPLELQYGENGGFESGITRSNSGDGLPLEIVFVQGGDRNINSNTYFEHSSTLRLPRLTSGFYFDGEHFNWEQDYDSTKGIAMIVDAHGYSVRLATATSLSTEGTLDLSEFYPKREGTVSAVATEASGSDIPFYDFEDDELGAGSGKINIDYQGTIWIEGEQRRIAFQSGMLIGREIGLNDFLLQSDKGVFKLAQEIINGVIMPGEGGFVPAIGDKYIVLGCTLPEAYIADNETHTGAEYDMLRKAAKYLYENCKTKLSFKGKLSGIYAKTNWNTIGGKLKIGGCISFSDESVQANPIEMRIIGIKTFINKPYKPEIEMSDEPAKGSVGSALQTIRNNFTRTDQQYYELRQYSNRQFREAKETMEMLEAAMLKGFTSGIYPIAVQTMQQIVGDESLQFRFVDSYYSSTVVTHTFAFDAATKKFSTAGGIIQHLTLGIDTLKSSHANSEYKYWGIAAYESAALSNADKRYYLYARCDKSSATATFLLSETAIALESETGYYHLLVGVLNSEYNGSRSFAPMYGYTEILPGRMTVDKIASDDGNNYIDLVRDSINIGSNNSGFSYNPSDGFIIKGALVQTGAGSYVGMSAWTGLYSSSRTYKYGDEVTATDSEGNTSSYVYIYATPSSGHAVTETSYWQAKAIGQTGAAGEDGITPEIGANGNWWIGSVDTGVKAEGEDGDDGDDGLTPYIGQNGNWWIGNTDTNVPAAGTSPIILSIDNEMDSIAVGPDGKLSSAATTVVNVALYRGTEALSITNGVTLGTLPTGITASTAYAQDGKSATITFTIAANTVINQRNAITITVTSGLNSKSVVYTLAAIRAGADGEIYSLVPNATIIHKTNLGAYSPSSITCDSIKNSGGTITHNPSEASIYVSLDGGSFSPYEDGGSGEDGEYIPGTDFLQSIAFRLYVTGTTPYVDTQTVYVVSDGTNGSDGQPGQPGPAGKGISTYQTQYAVSSSGSSAPSSGWVDSMPDIESIQPGYYLWQRTRPKYTDNTYGDWQYQCVRMGNNGAAGPATLYMGNYNSHAVYYATKDRCDIVYYTYTQSGQTIGKYFIGNPAYNGAIPAGETPWKNGELNATYWLSFGASFDTAAFGWVFAEKATFENAVVRHLRTAESGKRIIASGTSMEMYDATALRLKFHGDNLAEAGTSSSANVSSVGLISQTFTPDSQQGGVEGTAVARTSSIATVNVSSSANVVTLKAIPITMAASAASILEGAEGFSFDIYSIWEIDGEEFGAPASLRGLTTYGNTQIQDTRSIPAQTLSLPVGQHTFKIKTVVSIDGPMFGLDSEGDAYFTSAQLTAAINSAVTAAFSLTYQEGLTEIAANGLRTQFSSSYLFSASKTANGNDNTFQVLAKAGNYGLRVAIDGVKMTSDGGANWSSISSGGGTTEYAYVNLNGSNTQLTTSVSVYAPTTSGSAGQILKSRGANSAPAWVTPALWELQGGTEIPANYDLDAYVNAGTFYVPQNNRNISNCPTPNKAGVLIVFITQGNNTDYIGQKWRVFDSVFWYERNSTDGGNNWSDWLAPFTGSIDGRGVTVTPQTYAAGLRLLFRQDYQDGMTDIEQGLSGYHSLLFIRGYSSGSDTGQGAYPSAEIALMPTNSIYVRTGNQSQGAAWGAWEKILTSGNYSDTLGSVFHPKGGSSAQSFAAAEITISEGGKIFFGRDEEHFIYFDVNDDCFYASHEIRTYEEEEPEGEE